MTELDPDRIKEANRLFAQPVTFLLGAARLEQVPDTGLPEIALAGRSNVGKSSLINALLGRKGVARTSNTPGRTQQLNFFDLAGRLMICDLPGYGYAQAPKDQAAGWAKAVNAYLKGRRQLRRTLVLVDSRHGLKPSDHAVMAMLDAAAQPYQVILTKADKVTPGMLDRLMGEIGGELKSHAAGHPEILITSARKFNGVEALRVRLADLSNQPGKSENAAAPQWVGGPGVSR